MFIAYYEVCVPVLKWCLVEKLDDLILFGIVLVQWSVWRSEAGLSERHQRQVCRQDHQQKDILCWSESANSVEVVCVHVCIAPCINL